jgi:SAM-dependent methyltransferase
VAPALIAQTMLDQHPELQLDWDDAKLHDNWPNRLDHRFLLRRLDEITADTTLAGGTGRVLDVAAAGATHTCEMSLRGARAVALDPSPAMLQSARDHMATRGAQVMLVRGIAETLPFRDGSFDRVLCHSAIDHVAAPDVAAREMSRVLAPGGRLVISAVNYRSLSARLSRSLYAAARALGVMSRDTHLFWDSPVPIEHTFECSYERLRRVCAPYLEFEHAFGVSFGWGVPGWGGLLGRLPEQRAIALLRRLDRWAAGAPAMADFVYTIWRPRPVASWRLPLPGYAVQPDDVVYPHRIAGEAFYWAIADYRGSIVRPDPTGTRIANRAYTGDPGRSWLEDLIARGPFRSAAVLGCDEEQYEKAWLGGGGSERLDVYELSPGVIRKVRAGLDGWRRRARFIRCDLNFAELPEAHYDVIWSSGCLHHIVNLEHLFAQVARALRPGGLFALHDYVGERRRQYSPQRLARINALLSELPARFRLGAVERITAPDPALLSHFCATRSDDILPLAEQYFEPVHVARFSSLFPLPLYLDLAAMAREEPALLERLEAAEREAAGDPAMPACSAYAVFRKRP